ncbi:conserved hypothetical protein [Tenacibaculum dicentrarchi]|uniref:phospholipase D n=1 Tax=Tenacibaculum dicentrarchi TaxID=669041 RepID=A0ABM9NV43_9FLAO|nr:conserved hypothetical protein [Tenacibaculum dicentrarchi]
MKELVHTENFENKKALNNIFIPTDKKWISTENDNLSIIESGKNGVLFHKIITDIESAEEMICLQSFLIQDTKIIDALLKAKKERDVRVFVMGCAEAKLESNPYDEEDSFITKEYKKMLEDKFKNNFTHRQAGNLHAKFILIDPKKNSKGYIFTGNFNEKPFFENPELAVKLSNTQITELFKIFVYHFWEHTTDEQTNTSQFDKIKKINKFSLPHLSEILLTSPNIEISNLKKTLLEAVSKAKEEIQISTFGLDIKHVLSNKILDKLKAGIKVTIYCRPRLKTINDNIDVLAKHGAKIVCHPLIHAKSLIIDNNEAYIFSANFEAHGMDTGFEIGTKLNTNQKNDLLKIYANWKETFPFEYIHENKIINTDKYQYLNKEGKLTGLMHIENHENKKISKKITTLKDLNLLFLIKEPQKFSSKQLTIELKAEINSINNYIKIETINTESEIIEIKTGRSKKQKTEKVLLLNTSKISNIPNFLYKLNELDKNIKVYAK